MSRSRDIASIMGATEAENTGNISLGAGGGAGGGLSVYDSDGLFPDNPDDGALAYTTNDNFLHVYDAIDSNWSRVALNFPGSATGGTVTTIGSYRYHAFTTTGSNSLVVENDIPSADYIIVAGGGGGGYASNISGGGGGAGGVIYHEGYTGLTAGTYSITVGAGGLAKNQGSNSTAFGNTAIGGGKGGSANPEYDGGDGGSGGGGGVHSSSVTVGSALSQTTISGATAYGNAGGANYTGSPYYGGGGGGADAAGDAGTSSTAGDGGDGRLFSNFSSFGASGYFGGGGGAGAATTYGGTDTGTGGLGGGGNGGTAGSGSNGLANTGGGGGGGNSEGGSGIVIVRYAI